jgi:hypothetical protein
MPAKYARIPGARIMEAILRKIPLLLSKPKTRSATTVIPKSAMNTRSATNTRSVMASMKGKNNTSVYVLQLHGGLIYVGQSSNVETRIKQHMNGRGATFTKRHKPTGIKLPRLGNINGAGDSGERQEVLLQMWKNGMHSVRGWKYCNNNLSPSDIIDIKSNWVEMFNLCRVCMREGHMASSCKFKGKGRVYSKKITQPPSSSSPSPR